MLNSTNIKKELWNAISLHYEKECFNDSLKDACFYIIELLQQKGEIDDLDGEKLINELFSESKPKIIINSYETKSDKDEQRGFGFILRGIICAIRNPLSHSKKITFSKEEVDAIILFINNYILKRLDDTKKFSYVEDWYTFIFFENDIYNEKWFNAILDNIPKNERIVIMHSVVNWLDSIREEKYKYIINKLFDMLSKSEKDEIIMQLDKKLLDIGDDNYLRMFFYHFEPTIWKKLNTLSQLKIENIVYNSILKASMISNPNTNELECNDDGSLSTWVKDWIWEFSNKDEIINTLLDKLKYEAGTEFVFAYYYEIISEDKILLNYSSKINDGLKEGYIGYKKLIDEKMIFSENSDIVKIFKDNYDSFVERDSDSFDFLD